MERLIYERRELQDAFGWLHRETGRLTGCHAANWRRMFTFYTEGVREHYEALRLLARMLDGHAVDAGAWFEAAAKGSAPPPPAEGYPHVALVWKQLCAAVLKPGEGFFTNAQVDLPFVLSSAFPGESLGERFHHWKVAFVDPYVTLVQSLCEQLLQAAPEGGEQIDLWDLAMPILQSLPGPEGAEAATEAKAEADPQPKKKKKAKTSGAGKKTAKRKAANKKAAKK